MTPRRTDISMHSDKTAAQSKQMLNQFEKRLRSILDKFSKSHTLEKAHEELRTLMQNEISDNDRMMLFLSSLTDFNVHVQTTQKCE